ncbi:MAG TPA: sigma-70 family RNA polymerase sigma factor [Blastocatellia bacterium]|nr:sigma-70 family RNA polymerase sigma factor [Blastocatellia bacterium]
MSNPLKDWEFTQEDFERFLNWLDADRELAGRKYEAIRRGLIAIFNSRGCSGAEDLADETINRAIRQLPSIEGSYEGDPAKYIQGIARFVALEYFNRQVKRYGGPAPEDLPDPSRPGAPDEEDEREALSKCLRHCLKKLKPEKRKMFILYYREGNRLNRDHRRSLAEQLGCSINALRLQMHRLNEELRLCITDCRSQPPSDKNL